MHGRGQSDGFVVPEKSSNKDVEQAAERMEGRRPAEGNSDEQNVLRTQGRQGATSALERVREAAARDKRQRFTALLHHVYDPQRLHAAYRAIERHAAAGVDGETWHHYGKELESNLQDLSERVQRGAYRAQPVRRAYALKRDGRQRPLGVPTLEDKIVQRAVVEVLNAIYETDFVRFSYGFRTGCSAHQALDALAIGIHKRRVNWVLDADIRSFFDTLVHGWLVKFIEHRIADRRIVRLIQKWLKAGVLEGGLRTQSEVGTVQGGSISPLLSNIYLHYVFDLWVQQWRKKRASGQVVVVRFADDFIVGFEHWAEAEQFLLELRERFARFGLELHPEKTRLVAFGYKADRAWRSGQGDKPGTFNFLGFTHSCGKTRGGKFIVLRRTMAQRMRSKLAEIKGELRKRMHQPVPEQGAYLRAVLLGYFRYHGIPNNGPALRAFRMAVSRLWWRTLRRRSQVHRPSWRRVSPFVQRWLPTLRICQPSYLTRFSVIT